MAAPALSARAPSARERAAQGGAGLGGPHTPGSGLSLGGGEATEEELEALHQEHAAAVRCLRADYEARVQRGLELQRLLDECDASLRERSEQSARDALAQEQLASGRLTLERLAMRREDVAVGAGALLEARQREVRRLEGRLAELWGEVGGSRGPGRRSGAEEGQPPAPASCDLLAELRAAARAQEEKADVLGADLRQVLQHVVRACTEPSTPPGRPWPLREQPLLEARQAMRLSEQGQAHLEDLLRQGTAFGGASGAATEDGGLLRLGLLPGPLPCSSLLGAALEVDAQRGPAEEENADDYDPRATFNEEAWLLHDRLASEARCVTQAIFSDLPAEAGGEAASGSRAALLKGRELHRAAALGDHAALLRALKAMAPAVARSAGGGDAPLLGWTAWHSAAAHGHAAILEALDAHADSSLLHGLDRRSAAGYPPLALACLHGHVEAVRWLLKLRSPVEARDSRGNSPLLWAAAGDARWLSGSVSSSRRAIVQMLLDAKADPEARNASGHSARSLLDPELESSPCSSLSGASPASSQNEVGPRRPAASFGDLSEDGQRNPPRTSLLALASAEGPAAAGRGCHCIRTAGSAASEAEHHARRAGSVSSYLDFAMNMFASSDSAGFLGNEEAEAAAQLSHEERQAAVWSGWVRNFTHRGLRAALGTRLSAAEPVFADRYRQVAALTCERLLLFDTAAGWTLAGVVALAEISELLVPPQSDTMLLLRARRRPDVLLELAGPDARAELLDALGRPPSLFRSLSFFTSSAPFLLLLLSFSL
ncbi:unnamed protein product [Prorocentrum cordatum]|uniref:Uncharacterized protein n=1 Tax=Prorocentrum cordatum TaxID=2364126 RepID=A0ABN9VZJ4_9DINO|nr:unnamed protein product [Polarella glacialis]